MQKHIFKYIYYNVFLTTTILCLPYSRDGLLDLRSQDAWPCCGADAISIFFHHGYRIIKNWCIICTYSCVFGYDTTLIIFSLNYIICYFRFNYIYWFFMCVHNMDTVIIDLIGLIWLIYALFYCLVIQLF